MSFYFTHNNILHFAPQTLRIEIRKSVILFLMLLSAGQTILINREHGILAWDGLFQYACFGL